MAAWGLNSEHQQLHRVLVHRPRPCVQDLNADQLKDCHFDQPMKCTIAQLEHDHFTKTLTSHGAEVLQLDEVLAGDESAEKLMTCDPNLLFTRDISVMTPAGAVLMNMGLKQRKPEVDVVGRAYQRLGIPIAGVLGHSAELEGGGVIWISERIVAVGLCDRSTADTLQSFAKIVLEGPVDEVWGVKLPRGSVHIDGMMTVPGPGIAWIRPDVLGQAECQVVTTKDLRNGLFVNELERSGITIETFPTVSGMALNVIWTAPFMGIAAEADGIDEITLAADRYQGRLDVFDGEELVKGNGGAHCMTCPVQRSF